MEFDIFYVIAVILAGILGFAIYYVYSNMDRKKVNEVYGLLKSIWETYGDRIKTDDAQLYADLDDAVKTMDKAMSDGEISIMEAFNLAKSFIPLTDRLTKFIKDHYE